MCERCFYVPVWGFGGGGMRSPIIHQWCTLRMGHRIKRWLSCPTRIMCSPGERAVASEPARWCLLRDFNSKPQTPTKFHPCIFRLVRANRVPAPQVFFCASTFHQVIAQLSPMCLAAGFLAVFVSGVALPRRLIRIRVTVDWTNLVA